MNNRRMISIMGAIVFLLCGVMVNGAEGSNWDVMGGGGGSSGSKDYQLSGTIGQTATGLSSVSSVAVRSGFWQSFTAVAPCDCEPGNTDGNDIFNLMDATYLISYIYRNGPSPTPYAICSGDPNQDCHINLLDVTMLLKYLYLGGPVPQSCVEWRDKCGAL